VLSTDIKIKLKKHFVVILDMHLKPYNVYQENTAYSLTFSAPLQPQNNVKVMKSDIDKYSL